jgi:signal transduction histidine kinase
MGDPIESHLSDRELAEHDKQLSEGRQDQEATVDDNDTAADLAAESSLDNGLSAEKQREIMRGVFDRLDQEIKPVLAEFQHQIVDISDQIQIRLLSGGQIEEDDLDRLKSIQRELDDFLNSDSYDKAVDISFKNSDPLMELKKDVGVHDFRHFDDSLKKYIEYIKRVLNLRLSGADASDIDELGMPKYLPVDLEHYTYGFESEQGPISIGEDDLNEEIKDVEYYLRRRYTEPAGIITTVDLPQAPTMIRTDKKLGIDILGDLVRNAVAAMPEGGQLIFKVEHQGENAVLTISDTGVGIPKEDLNKVLTEGFTTKPDGTGMGLALARRYFEDILNGEFSIESEVGKGTKITITLPLANDTNHEESHEIKT